MEGSRAYAQHFQLYFHVFQSFSLNTKVTTHVLQSLSLNTNNQSLKCSTVRAQHKLAYIYHQ